MRGKWEGIAEEIRRKVETWSCCERWKFPRINLQKRLQHLHFFPHKIFSQLLIFIGRQLGQIHRLKLDSSELWKLERNHPESGQFSVFNWWLAAPLLRSLRSANLLLQPPSLPQYQSHFSFHHPDNKEILYSNKYTLCHPWASHREWERTPTLDCLTAQPSSAAIGAKLIRGAQNRKINLNPSS